MTETTTTKPTRKNPIMDYVQLDGTVKCDFTKFRLRVKRKGRVSAVLKDGSVVELGQGIYPLNKFKGTGKIVIGKMEVKAGTSFNTF